MKTTTTVCDRCGKELNPPQIAAWRIEAYRDGFTGYKPPGDMSCDFCDACFDYFRREMIVQ